MKFPLKNDELKALPGDMVALGAFQDQLGQSPVFQGLDREAGGVLGQIASEEDFTCKKDQTLLVHTSKQLGQARVLIVGLGKREDFSLPDSRSYAAVAARAATSRGCKSLILTQPPVDASALDKAVQFLVEGVILGRYRFEQYICKDDQTRDLLDEVTILFPSSGGQDELSGAASLSVTRGQIVADGICWARDLVNEPPSSMTPMRLADLAQAMAKDVGLGCKILGQKECEKQRMNLLLGVARGSEEEPRFIHLTHTPMGREKPKRRFVLVGKGVTFDSGGLSLKPTSGMLDMKGDMAGAAAVLGAARALPSLGLQSEVHILVPATENMISGQAFKLGDVITGFAGKSVEIVNTDAEGRLILADALAYGDKLSPDEMIDVATLTGACVVALGPFTAGAMGNDRALVEHFLASSRMAGEDFWHLPLPVRLKEQLKTPVADLKNCGDRWGGALTAGLFLKEFVGKSKWLHLDIAGPFIAEKEAGHTPKGATGFGVASLLEYLQGRDDAP